MAGATVDLGHGLSEAIAVLQIRERGIPADNQEAVIQDQTVHHRAGQVINPADILRAILPVIPLLLQADQVDRAVQEDQAGLEAAAEEEIKIFAVWFNC